MFHQTIIPRAIKRYLSCFAIQIAASLALSADLTAGPLIAAGDTVLRHDIQVLADHGFITGPVTSWPLAWGPILAELDDVDLSQSWPPEVTASLQRVEAQGKRATRANAFTYSARVSVADSPMRIRGFEGTPRETAEIGAGMSWTGKQFSATLKGQISDRSDGRGEARVDGSMIGMALGNYAISVNTFDRWWGPGWDGSIILSNNARPIPSVAVDRLFTDAFDIKWLRWLGPWDVNAMMGQLESSRHVPNALFLGMRFNFRPLSSLEIGLSRTAMWCGSGRPCDSGTLADLLLGHDNRGDDSIVAGNEPGNQLAGIDIRFSHGLFGLRGAVYGQFIGEDEAGGFPSRYLGQAGIEASGWSWNRWSWRVFAEFSGTSCQFHESSEMFNCGYNHSVYRTGYRYRSRPIGHGADNDARLVSVGVILADNEYSRWRALIRTGTLNRGGAPDVRNTLTPIPQKISSLDVAHSWRFRYGEIDVGLGYERTNSSTIMNNDDFRFHLQWRTVN